MKTKIKKQTENNAYDKIAITCDEILRKIENDYIEPILMEIQEHLQENHTPANITKFDGDDEYGSQLEIKLSKNIEMHYKLEPAPDHINATVQLFKNNYLNFTEYYELDLPDVNSDNIIDNFSDVFEKIVKKAEKI